MNQLSVTARIGAMLMAMGAAGFGCGEMPDGPEDELGDVTQVHSELFPAGWTLWSPAAGQNTTVLNVCWENPTAAGGSATTRGWAQNAVENVWTWAWIDFNWSTTCTGNEQVRIKLEDKAGSAPHTNGLGREHGKVYLNHAFLNYDNIGRSNDPADGTCGSAANRQNCIERIAVHEFGHVLGLAHDQNRRDTACPNGPEQGTSGDFPMGRPDPESIMSYCPDGTWSGPTWSDLDLLQIQRLYGGWDAPTYHGGTFALRPQAGWFYRFGLPPAFSGPPILAQSSTVLQEIDGTRNMMVVRKRVGTGRVHYGDEISLQDQRSSLYYCPSTLVVVQTPACGQCMPGIQNIPVTAGSTAPCWWTPSRTSTGIGGSEIHVNDPFILTSNGQSFTGGNSTTSLRFLGDFFPN